ncbi:putative flavoprotein wrbA (Trp repressor-binding protein) (plasmid) [Deinococcus deserti VCD115]|uniref:Putative flavoprotein wrbA (Trp repressor-binding protein) n=2 Tax=Deinococcus TaxID=1298 RepID=C1D3I3_DEIDV|nr:putative flavoprotein wrbA (Trp repressor-binding protein) [Deinococcus deserti VCD115]
MTFLDRLLKALYPRTQAQDAPQESPVTTPSPVRMTIVYYSTYGTNHQMAEVAAEAARESGAEVRLVKARETAPQEVVNGQDAWRAQQERTAHVPEATPADLENVDAILFSSPTRFGGATSQIRAYIDTLGGLWGTGALANKTFSAMTSAQNPHGGQETTLQTLYITAMHWGAILTPPGYTDPVLFASGGNPYGASVTANGEPLSEADKASIRHQVRRQIEITQKLKAQ